MQLETFERLYRLIYNEKCLSFNFIVIIYFFQIMYTLTIYTLLDIILLWMKSRKTSRTLNNSYDHSGGKIEWG